ncbi:unnamed protein product [Closterium sp. NIES-64]|nr:unnamed protein product [Closterium sp. NIES-64]
MAAVVPGRSGRHESIGAGLQRSCPTCSCCARTHAHMCIHPSLSLYILCCATPAAPPCAAPPPAAPPSAAPPPAAPPSAAPPSAAPPSAAPPSAAPPSAAPPSACRWGRTGSPSTQSNHAAPLTTCPQTPLPLPLRLHMPPHPYPPRARFLCPPMSLRRPSAPVVQLDPVARRRHRNMLGALLVGTLQVGVGSRHAAGATTPTTLFGAPPQPLWFGAPPRPPPTPQLLGATSLPAPFLPITVFPQRAREEEERDAELLARRAMIQQKAEQRVAEQSERLKEQERERILQQRKRDLVLRARLMAKAEEKEVHLLARHWHRHRSLLSHFIRTQASPPIMYLPARPSPPTDKLLQAQAQSLEEWQQNQERKVQQLVADSLQRHLAEADRLMLPQGGVKATKGEKGAGSDSDDQRMDSVVDEEEERDERKEGTSEVRVKEEKVAAPDGELLKEEGVDGEGKGKGLEGESSGVRQQHAEEASGGTGGAREEGLRDKYKGDEGKEEEGVEERGEEVRRERRARGDKGREEEGEGREKGGEGREKGGEGREKGGEGREKGGRREVRAGRREVRAGKREVRAGKREVREGGGHVSGAHRGAASLAPAPRTPAPRTPAPRTPAPLKGALLRAKALRGAQVAAPPALQQLQWWA